MKELEQKLQKLGFTRVGLVDSWLLRLRGGLKPVKLHRTQVSRGVTLTFYRLMKQYLVKAETLETKEGNIVAKINGKYYIKHL